MRGPPEGSDCSSDWSQWHHCSDKRGLTDVALKAAWQTEAISFVYHHHSHEQQRVTVWLSDWQHRSIIHAASLIDWQLWWIATRSIIHMASLIDRQLWWIATSSIIHMAGLIDWQLWWIATSSIIHMAITEQSHMFIVDMVTDCRVWITYKNGLLVQVLFVQTRNTFAMETYFIHCHDPCMKSQPHVLCSFNWHCACMLWLCRVYVNYRTLSSWVKTWWRTWIKAKMT